MTTPEIINGKKYVVFADHVNRVCQEIEAESPQAAFEAVNNGIDEWQNCFDCEESDDYRLSNEVYDVQTEEFVAINGSSHCKTCGSEIVASVNDSLFGDGECGGCEYARYRGDPDLLGTLREIRDLTESLDYENGDLLGKLDEQEKALDAIRHHAYAAINRRHGTPQRE